jgi:hypothetical protein
MATIAAPGTHLKPKVTVFPEALVFGTRLDRFLQPAQRVPQAEEPDREPAGATS